MIPILFFLLTIAVFGTVVFVYLHRVQSKITAPKDKYDEEWDKVFQEKKTLSYSVPMPSTITSRVIMFYATFVGVVSLSFWFTAIIKGTNIDIRIIAELIYLPLAIIMSSPLFLPFFPIGLGMVIMPESGIGVIIGYLLYMVICSLGFFVKSRQAFIIIYLIFIMLLIMNVIGCSRIDFSGIS